MLVRGPRPAIDTLLLHSNFTKGRLVGGQGPWANPRMDARFLTRPLGGIVNNGLSGLDGSGSSSAYEISGPVYGDSISNMYDTSLGDFVTNHQEGDFNLEENFFFSNNQVGAVPALVLSGLSIDGGNLMGTFTPMIVQQTFGVVTTPLLPLHEGLCTSDA